MHVGNVDEVKSGEPLIKKVNGREIGVFHENGKWFAVKNSCPHKQGPLCKGTVGGTMVPSEVGQFCYGLEGIVLRCPWHGWEFSLNTGKALFGISDRKVASYTVIIEEDKIYVEL